jgi:hypothetical protein
MGFGLTVREYEEEVLGWLRQHVVETLSWLRREGWMIRVEDVRLDVSEHERMVLILFRDETRPQCLFGWRFPSNDREETDPEVRRSWGPPQAEAWVSIVLTNFEEQIMAEGHGLPPECAPESIAWVGDYKP